MCEKCIEAIVQQCPGRLFVKTTEGIYLMANETFAKEAGCEDAASIAGKRDEDLSWPDLAEQYRADDQRVIDSGEPLTVVEPATDATGRTFTVQTTKQPLRNSAGGILGVIGVSIELLDH
ncbi:MAG: PAS domain-containing protein [Phycisphaerales bacterium]|nr:PAS domain-containing protein [Phycisphaerales bacterium]